MIDGLSAGTLAELARLERTRTCLWPGAVRAWAEHVRLPRGRTWPHPGHGACCCCPDPWESRELLDQVARALSRRGARELRRVLAGHDQLWDPAPRTYRGEGPW
ncbi:hypothetical protein MA546_06980 [Streptomyces sp. T7(2022)]|uniref:hypothetical protein n=1 Tax=Streptomyces sp. T7(2022) TaxID=2916034 RepID=UPI001EE42180|nr:hypothetical protein [Streptomyces sp. T7(2022)]MCG5118519.1 hypothetical protein [Streptomyces sp. T7(2022)]